MISDRILLDACREGGPLGELVYRQACAEWRQAHEAWLRERAERELDGLLRDAAGAAWMAVMLRRGLAAQGRAGTRRAA